MSTSANVIEYNIVKNAKSVGHFRKHILCSQPDYADLLSYQPLDAHYIRAYGYDEDEEYWEDEPENLKDFMIRIAKNGNQKVREYFKTYHPDLQIK
jgi:hypothetical protein